ncbi:PDZ/DHR/GLGF domain-containing protein, partial [Streptomyces microflavus]
YLIFLDGDDTLLPEALRTIADRLTLVRVKTLDDARKSLEQISAGKTDALPSCSAG